jgi:hypothetical protein
LIVAEPPPHVTLEDFTKLNPKLLGTASTQRRKIGYDGWVKDIVVTLPAVGDAERRELLDQINYYLFGTTYKAGTLQLPARRPPLQRIPLDVRVATADLHRWLIAGSIAFRGIGDAGASAMAQLLGAKRSGVYLSEQAGLAVWILPRAGQYGQFTREARQFALDSDLIIGAIANETHLALIARERIVPLTALPPLRAETILQLADAADDSLAQSYQRNYVLAGKYDAQRDWAPIYLSDTLVDSEYGSLLNITDQLLKSWSLSGKIKYLDFPYPPPPSYPFPRPLTKMPEIEKAMATTNEGLTFNWNTNGVGYVDDAAGFRVYALNRTGALPISYLSGEKNNSRYEKDAYRWFAEAAQDPNLARVVQYAAIYQIFHEFRIRTGVPPPVPNRQPDTMRLAAAVAAALNDIRRHDCDKSAISSRNQSRREMQRLMQVLGLGNLDYSCKMLDSVFSDYGERGIRRLARLLTAVSTPKADVKLLQFVFTRPEKDREGLLRSLPPETQAQLNFILISRQLATDQIVREALAERIPRDKARDLFAAGTVRRDDGWIRTASIVVSWPTGELNDLTGGHNLDAKVGRFVQDAGLKAGEVRVSREGTDRIIRYSPGDRTRITEWLHAAAVENNDAALQRALKAASVTPPQVPPGRAIPVALKFEPKGPGGRGLNEHLAGLAGFETPGWGSSVKATAREATLTEALRAMPARVLNVERLENGYYRVLESQTGRVYQARSMTDVLDTVVTSLKRAPGKPPTTLTLSGFDDGGAINFRRTTELWMRREGFPDARVAAMRVKDGMAPARAFERLAEKGDLSRARFGEWSVVDAVSASGRPVKVFEATIHVPAKAGGIHGFLIKIRLFFESLLPPHKMKEAEALVLTALGRLPKDATAQQAATVLERELRSRFPLDSLVLETGDLVIVQLHREDPDAVRFAG